MFPILTYHAIGSANSPVFLSPTDFESQLSAFAEAGYKTISLSKLLTYLEQNSPLPERTFIITFDDGYTSVYHEAWPRLQAYGFGATVFVISDLVGGDNQWAGQPAGTPHQPLMTWQQLETLAEQGWEIGAHTRTHPSLPTLSLAQAEDEMLGSQHVLADRFGQSVETFAYPYGHTTPAITQLAQKHFRTAVSTRLDFATSHSEPHDLERLDAFYLTPMLIRNLTTLPGRAYITLRRYLRQLRSR